LRWFCWRINAWSEIFAMVVSSLLAFVLVLFVSDEAVARGPIDGFTMKLLICVGVTSVAWVVGTLITPPESQATLRKFYRKCHPGGPGWAKIVAQARNEGDMIDEKVHGRDWEMPLQVLCVFLGCMAVYCSLFSIGGIIYGNWIQAAILGAIAIVSAAFLFKFFGRISAE
jgi:solute:Na+ symporter, SSS family